jgi:hypothetical protein
VIDACDVDVVAGGVVDVEAGGVVVGAPGLVDVAGIAAGIVVLYGFDERQVGSLREESVQDGGNRRTTYRSSDDLHDGIAGAATEMRSMGREMGWDSRIGYRYSLGMDEGEECAEEGQEDGEHVGVTGLCAELSAEQHGLVGDEARAAQGCVCPCT